MVGGKELNVVRNELGVLAGLVIVTLGIGSVVFHYLENLTWIDSVYFSVITLTTVGYGDIAPVTTFGKIFVSIYILLGIGIIFGFINALSKRRLILHRRKKPKK